MPSDDDPYLTPTQQDDASCCCYSTSIEGKRNIVERKAVRGKAVIVVWTYLRHHFVLSEPKIARVLWFFAHIKGNKRTIVVVMFDYSDMFHHS